MKELYTSSLIHEPYGSLLFTQSNTFIADVLRLPYKLLWKRFYCVMHPAHTLQSL
jgi:hypothetical protein